MRHRGLDTKGNTMKNEITLSEGQSQAVNHFEGPCIVIAPPGSGKTKVITERTKMLIEGHQVEPHKILVITFTKAAAEEMKIRFKNQMQGIYTPVQFGTFHAIFFSILKHAYHYNASNILRENQKKQFFREILQQLSLEIEDENEFLAEIESEISLVKGEMISLDHYYPINCSVEAFQSFYQKYEEKLRQYRLIDFDDMLVYCYELFKQRSDILKIWQDQFEYILIDEFQDINKVQYDIVRMLAKPKDNLFIVGDDDQSIYRFRGAKPEIMLKFQNDYQNAKKIVLDMNYRSTKSIIEMASKVIVKNKKRFQKKINTIHEQGAPVQIQYFESLVKENQKVVNTILNYQKKGISLSEIAILFRTNTQPGALIEKIMEYNIAFRMKDSIPNLYEHWIAKNIITYIKLALGKKERGQFLQIMNRPKRYISRECIDMAIVDFERLRMYYEDKRWMIERIDRLEYDLKVIKSMNPYAAIQYIRKGIGYEEYLKEYATYRRIKADELFDVLDEIQEGAKEFEQFEDWFVHIEHYGEELKKQVQQTKDQETEAITLATMHSSKGLEYQVVILIDVNEGIVPHRKAVLDADLEEERRMFYVAMTRAKKYLHIFYVKERYNKEMEPSRFLEDCIDANKLPAMNKQ